MKSGIAVAVLLAALGCAGENMGVETGAGGAATGAGGGGDASQVGTGGASASGGGAGGSSAAGGAGGGLGSGGAIAAGGRGGAAGGSSGGAGGGAGGATAAGGAGGGGGRVLSGSDGTACPSGTPGLQSWWLMCDGHCIDPLGSDTQNCGGCKALCPSGSKCVTGRCWDSTGTTRTVTQFPACPTTTQPAQSSICIVGGTIVRRSDIGDACYTCTSGYVTTAVPCAGPNMGTNLCVSTCGNCP